MLDPNTENKILEIAEKLFLEKGYELTSTIQIAKAVGCNQTLIHYYFRTKENLFKKIFESRFRNFFTEAFAANEEETVFEKKIEKLIFNHFEMLEKNPQMPLLIVREIMSKNSLLLQLREEIELLPRKIFESLDTQMKELVKQGKIKDITVFDLFFTALSLNVSAFILSPLAFEILDVPKEIRDTFIKKRKYENVNIILSYLKIEN